MPNGAVQIRNDMRVRSDRIVDMTPLGDIHHWPVTLLLNGGIQETFGRSRAAKPHGVGRGRERRSQHSVPSRERGCRTPGTEREDRGAGLKA